MFDAEIYLEAANRVGPYVKREHFRSYPAVLSEMPDVKSCIYIALDGANIIRYVGSSRRGSDTMRARLREHKKTRDDAWQWTEIWVIELIDGLPKDLIFTLEGRVGRPLLPSDNGRLPCAVVL